MSQQINLYNSELLRKRENFSVVSMLQGLAIITFGMVAFYVYVLYQVNLLNTKSKELNIHSTTVQAQLLAYTADFSQKQAKQMLDDELKKAEAQLSSQGRLIEMLKNGSIGNTTGYSEYMRAFARQSISGLWLTGFDISGSSVRMSIRGGLLNPEILPSFIKRLNQEKVMRGKEFTSLKMQQHKVDVAKPAGRSYLEFTLISGDAEAEGESP